MAWILPRSASPEVQPNPPQFFEDCPAHNVTNGFLMSPMSPCSGLTHAAQSEHARIPAYSGAGNPETPFMQKWNDTSPLHPGGPPTDQKIICLLSWRIENSHLSTGVQM
jgi:hypothetical protein